MNKAQFEALVALLERKAEVERGNKGDEALLPDAVKYLRREELHTDAERRERVQELLDQTDELAITSMTLFALTRNRIMGYGAQMLPVLSFALQAALAVSAADVEVVEVAYVPGLLADGQ